MKKRFLSIFWVLTLMFSFIPAMSNTASAAESVAYIQRDWNGTKVVETRKECADYTLVDENTNLFEDGKWYVVKGDITNDKRIYVTGTANLILVDGSTLNIEGGIYAPVGNTLNIYGQDGDSGVLHAIGSTYNAAIGGSKYIHGGTVNIFGGIVRAFGGYDAAGIGGGYAGDGGNITVFGGKVNAVGGGESAGIGGGYEGDGSNVTIYGGSVTTMSGGQGRGIGAGDEGSKAGTISIADNMHLYSGEYAPGTQMTVDEYMQNGGKFVSISVFTVKYIDRSWDGKEVVETQKECADYTLVDEEINLFEDGKWYVVKGDITNEKRINVSGTANLILVDGSTLNIEGGIFAPKGNTLNIYGQSGDSGVLHATGSLYNAGIGGGKLSNGGTINFFGGTVETTGGFEAAGIGGGSKGDGGNITVFGGTVNATGGEEGAGIGGGYEGDGGNLTIYGGSVTATTGGQGRGIGAGDEGTKEGNISVADDMRIRGGDSEPGAKMTIDEYIKNGSKYVNISAPVNPVKYIDRYIDKDSGKLIEEEKKIYDDEYTVVTNDMTEMTDGWYVVNGDVTIGDRIRTSGSVKLILCDGAKLEAESGIEVASSIDPEGGSERNTLTIYGQKNDSGKLAAQNSDKVIEGTYEAAIGSTHGKESGNIAICGGTVTATGMSGSGIGGGDGGIGKVTISGGVVKAESERVAIGGRTGKVTINGGAVTAISTGHRSAVGSTLILGDGVTFGAGTDDKNITVRGDKNNASDALNKPYFVTPCHIHTYDQEVVSEKYLKSEASCTDAAVYYKSCVCGEAGTSDVFTSGKALGHDWDNGTVTKEPTCKETGVKTFECSRCHDTKTEPVPLAAHTLKPVAAVAPNCTKDGVKAHYQCEVCDKLFSDEEGKTEITEKDIVEPKLGHAFSTEWTIDKEPTLTEPGSKSHHCTRCDEKTDVTEIPTLDVIRIFGNTRYDTALDSADKLLKLQGKTKFDNVIVACGSNFPDALTGSYLAKKKNAPILLVDKSVESKIADYIKSNLSDNGTVYILGGTGAVSSGFEKKLVSEFGKSRVERLQGANRYSTNIAILKAAGVADEDIIICTGSGYADSLSASAVGRPILLVDKALSAEQKSYLSTLKTSKAYVVGGTGVVSDGIVKEYNKLSGITAVRVWGANRYATSTAVAKEFFDSSCGIATLAYAQNFPDGLSGGPVAMALNAPLILTDNNSYADAKAYCNGAGVKQVYVFGGKTLISDKVAKAMIK